MSINNREDVNKYSDLINSLLDHYIDTHKIRPSSLRNYLKPGGDKFNKFLERNKLKDIAGEWAYENSYNNYKNLYEQLYKTPKGKDKEKESVIELQLGDVIHITNPVNEKLNDQTFIIDYIDKRQINLINVDDLTSLKLKINDEEYL